MSDALNQGYQILWNILYHLLQFHELQCISEEVMEKKERCFYVTNQVGWLVCLVVQSRAGTVDRWGRLVVARGGGATLQLHLVVRCSGAHLGGEVQHAPPLGGGAVTIVQAAPWRGQQAAAGTRRGCAGTKVRAPLISNARLGYGALGAASS